MNFDQTNRWLTLISNIGVLIGIVLILMELKQNERIIKSQIRNDISTQIVDLLTANAVNAELANIRRRGDLGDSLNLDEEYRYERFTRGFFRYWENVHYQYRKGMYEEEEYERHMKAIENSFGKSNLKRVLWCRNQFEFSEEFRQTINNMSTVTCNQ